MRGLLRLSLATEWAEPPTADEIEITLLGRGFGESVVLHLCDGDWVVIDSLLDKRRLCAPLEYLQGLGVAPDHIHTVLATHFHDDHIGGISQLYDAAKSAKLAMSLPKTARELYTYLSANAVGGIGKISSGVDELAKLVQIRKSQGRDCFRHCQADLTLVRKASAAANVEITLTALSPIPADIDDFLLQLGAAAVDGQGTATRLMAFEPNDISVAAWLAVGNDAVLLGADLETKARADRGWKAVIASTERPKGQASVYKVAHHGSENGDHPDIWNVLLEPRPISMLSPFNKGVGRPKRSDVERILAASDEAYTTNRTPFRRYRDGTPVVRTALEADNISIRAGNSEVGRVTLRRKICQDATWRVYLSDGASHLKEFVPRD